MFNLDVIGKLFEGDDKVAVAGITGIAAIVGTHYFTKNRYRIESKDKGFVIAPGPDEKSNPEPEPMPEQKPKPKPKSTKKNQAK